MCIRDRGKRLVSLESKDGEMWRKVVGYVITAVIGIVRIVLPIELRRAMEIEDGSPLEIYVEEDSIVLKACKPVCIFCGSDQSVEEFKGRCVCASCRGELRGGK